MCRILHDYVGIHTNLRKNSSPAPRRSGGCDSSQVWQCYPRGAPSIRVHQMLGTVIISHHSVWSQLVGVSRTGRLITKSETQLAESKTFFKEPSDLEVMSYGKPLTHLQDYYISCIWLHPSGEGIILGFHRGYIQVLEEGSFVMRGDKVMKCPGKKCTCRSDMLISRSCVVSCIDYHPTRKIIYWSCNHAIFGKADEDGALMSAEQTVRAVCMKLAPSGAYLATTHVEEGVRIWDAYRLQLVHHLLPHVTVGKALDWHPWVPNLLATGVFHSESPIDHNIHIWRCNLEQPQVAAFLHEPLDIFILLFHPLTGELIYAQYKGDDDENALDKGESTLVVLNGHGHIVDCSEPHPGLITHMFWAPNLQELLVGGMTDILVRYFVSEKRKSIPYPDSLPTMTIRRQYNTFNVSSFTTR